MKIFEHFALLRGRFEHEVVDGLVCDMIDVRAVDVVHRPARYTMCVESLFRYVKTNTSEQASRIDGLLTTTVLSSSLSGIAAMVKR